MRAHLPESVMLVPAFEAMAECAWQALASCELCALRWRVNRRGNARGPCRLSDRTYVFRLYVSYAEELELSPALMIYLAGCNFRCAFCTQAPPCFRPDGNQQSAISNQHWG